MKEYFLWLAKFLTSIVVLVVLVPLALVATVAAVGQIVSGETSGQPTKNPKKSVAILELTGVIENSKDVIEQLYKQVKNDKVRGIVLRINSPGGAVGPSQEIYDTIKKLRAKKPIVASMDAVAASGGFYVAMGASKVYANPGTLTGSIGVIMQLPNFQKVADWAGVQMVTIKSGALKDVGNSFREMTPPEREFLEKTVHEVYEQFLTAVSESRGIDKDKARAFADGRVILGSQALELGLIDGFGGVYEAARAVFKELGEPLGDDEMPELVYPTERFKNLEWLMGSKIAQTFFTVERALGDGPRLEYRMLP